MRSSFKEEEKRFCGKVLAKSSIINKRGMPDPFDNRPSSAARELPAHVVTLHCSRLVEQCCHFYPPPVALKVNQSPLGTGNTGSKHIYSTFLTPPLSPLKRLLILELHIQSLKQLYTCQAWGLILRLTMDASEWLVLRTAHLVIDNLR